jgi:hypothetical protein
MLFQFVRLISGTTLLSICSCAGAVNLLSNPNLNTNTTGWNAQSEVTLSFNAVGSSAGSGSAGVTNSSATPSNGLGMNQCVSAITVGSNYTYGGKINYPSAGQSGTGPMYIGVNWMDGPNCSGNTISQTPLLAVNSPNDTWATLTGGSVTAPAGTVSALFQAFPSKVAAGGSITGLFDDLYFDDGMATVSANQPIPTLSEWSLIILTSLLALGALFAFRRPNL